MAKPNRMEKLITRDHRLLFIFVSYIDVLAVYVNLIAFKSPLVGVIVLATYFCVNSTFLGAAFFAKEEFFFRLTLGVLVLTMLIGFLGWLVMIIYNLDVAETALVLFSAATISSLLSRRIRSEDVE